MTGEELRNIVLIDIEAWMKEDEIWPTRGGLSLYYTHPRWFWYYGPQRYSICHPDDAAAQIERGLVGWALNRGYGLVKCENRYHVGPQVYVAPSLLHALLSAYRAAKEIKI